jgi:hypothetical protein
MAVALCRSRRQFHEGHRQGALRTPTRALSSQVQEMLSAFHLTERQTSYHYRGAHQQSNCSPFAIHG